MGIMRTKSVEQSIRDTEEPEFRLRKALGALDLTLFGIGVIIGTGLFVLTGEAAAGYAGPAVALSYVVGGIVCALAALCYAEFASTVPVAGSAYTFSYASLGEFVAWLIGWDLILEFTLGAATVAKGWSGYLVSVLELVGIKLPPGLYAADGRLLPRLCSVDRGRARDDYPGHRDKIELSVQPGNHRDQDPRYAVHHRLRDILHKGLEPHALYPATEAAARSGGGDTSIVRTAEPRGDRHHLRRDGHLHSGGAGLLRLHRLHIVATTAEETRNPQRDVPIGILGSLAICTVLYILASIVFTGLAPYTKLATAAPAATALERTPFPAAQLIVSLAILIGLTVVVMILILGQSRVAFAMSRDNLLPLWFSRVHHRFRTPYRITIITGTVAGLLAFWLPLVTLAELVNIGTLAAFVLVSIGVIVLRRTRPDLPRAFKVPGYPVVPILSALL